MKYALALLLLLASCAKKETPAVDASVAEVRALGGTVYRAPADIPNVGRYALVADPQGAVFALYDGHLDD